MNKYVARRLVAGVVVTPLVAGIYFVLYLDLMLLGAKATGTPSQVFTDGLLIGAIVSVWFALDAIKLGRGRK